MIQILTYSGNEEKLRGEGIRLNKIHDAEALDSFEINIISLQDDNMWVTRERTLGTICLLYTSRSYAGMYASSMSGLRENFLRQLMPVYSW